MAKKFFLGSNTVENVTFLRVSGVIDEDNKLASSLKRIDGRTVVIDLAGVERINSCGVRDWVNWLNDLESRSKQVVLVRCSPCIVNQINLVNNFTGGGRVKSFFAPYYCPKCDIEQLRLLQVEQFAEMAQPQAPEHRAPDCNEVQCEMEFDDIEASYFAFLPRNTGTVVDERLVRLLEGFSPDVRDRIKRLDHVEASSDGGRTSISAQYSPLTVTRSSLSANREAVDEPEAAPAEEKIEPRSLVVPMLGAAVAILSAIIVYFVFAVAGQ